jgi:hypothetical protein
LQVEQLIQEGLLPLADDDAATAAEIQAHAVEVLD